MTILLRKIFKNTEEERYIKSEMVNIFAIIQEEIKTDKVGTKYVIEILE